MLPKLFDYWYDSMITVSAAATSKWVWTGVTNVATCVCVYGKQSVELKQSEERRLMGFGLNFPTEGSETKGRRRWSTSAHPPC